MISPANMYIFSQLKEECSSMMCAILTVGNSSGSSRGASTGACNHTSDIGTSKWKFAVVMVLIIAIGNEAKTKITSAGRGPVCSANRTSPSQILDTAAEGSSDVRNFQIFDGTDQHKPPSEPPHRARSGNAECRSPARRPSFAVPVAAT